MYVPFIETIITIRTHLSQVQTSNGSRFLNIRHATVITRIVILSANYRQTCWRITIASIKADNAGRTLVNTKNFNILENVFQIPSRPVLLEWKLLSCCWYLKIVEWYSKLPNQIHPDKNRTQKPSMWITINYAIIFMIIRT